MPRDNKRRISLVCEGATEYEALPHLARKLDVVCCRSINIHGQNIGQPLAQFVEKKIRPAIETAVFSNPDLIIVVLDREQRAQCPGELALEIETLIARDDTKVVIANSTIENWMLADRDNTQEAAFIKKRLPISIANNTDGRDAINIISNSMSPLGYNKTTHGVRLLTRVDVSDPQVLGRSKSLNKFVSTVTGV